MDTDELEDESMEISGWQLNVFKLFWENGTLNFSLLELMNFWNNHTFVVFDIRVGRGGVSCVLFDYDKDTDDVIPNNRNEI